MLIMVIDVLIFSEIHDIIFSIQLDKDLLRNVLAFRQKPILHYCIPKECLYLRRSERRCVFHA